IIREADPNSLILLDELGAGTDPAEGAALGMAILDHLHSTGARTIATTHHSQLKVHAHNRPGMENASVEFDPQTLKPTYRLLVGVPGSSNALKIAYKLGMPQEILEKAKEYMGSEAVAVEEMLTDMERTRREMERNRRVIAEKLSEAEERAKRYEEMLARIEREREEIIHSAEEEARRILSGARRTIERAIEEIRRQQASKESIKRAHEAIENLRRSLQRERREDRKGGVYSRGELVRIRSLDAAGKVVRIRDDRGEALIQVGGVELTVPISDIERLEPGEEVKLTPPQLLQIRLTKRASISPQINLIGCTADEAKRKLDKYLDDAFLAGLEQVRVIHGRGTGALKRAVRELLTGHPHVRSFRFGNPPEGGDGVTVVTLETG
ncbi:MAG TPA: endonuclease MutS2, partial [Candidatus Latescibacteria bacterium]|nr:endonuclease MutS2 [Candidatus Latescibacterota bacterium]